MIPVFYRGHLFSCPLGTFIIVVMYMEIHVFFKFFECFALRSIYFILQMAEEWFSRSIIQTVSFSRHGLYATHVQELFWIARMGIVEPLIGLNTCSFEFIVCIFGLKFLESLLYYIQSQTKGDVPWEYFTTCHIFDYGKIAPLILVGNVGDIGSEFPEWNIGSEFTIQYIWCCPMLLSSFLYESVRVFSSHLCEQIVCTHDSEHFLVVHSISFFLKFHGDDPVSVFLVVFFHKFSDELQVWFLLVFFGLS